MGIFRKVGDWLTEKSDRFIRGDASAGGYYGSREAEQTYAGTGAYDAEGDENEEQHAGVDPFGNGDGDYGGRVPYRSRYDLEREAQQAQQQQPAAQPQMQQTMRQQPVPQAAPQAYAYGAPQGYQQQPQGYQQQPSGNVVPFPGMQQSTDGAYYAHVEYVVSIHSRNECKDVIAYMKANASVFLNMEFIASDSERQRCVDLLSGAAYTLNCKLNKISLRGIYLISSPSVRVIMDGATQRISSAPDAQGFARQRYDAPGYAYAAERQEPPAQQPVTGFSSGSPTTRFQAQGTQRNPPVSFGNMMTGNPQESGYAAAGGQGGYTAQAYSAQR